MDDDDTDEREYASFKSFHLLNALSDLMMLPKDMLLSKSIRKEVQPWDLNHLILSLVCVINIRSSYLWYFTSIFEGMPFIWCTIDQEGC